MAELLKVAVLGTAQGKADEVVATGTPVDALVARVPEVSRERRVLLEAGGLAALRRAAAVRELAPALPATAPRDVSPVAAPALASMLRAMLLGDHAELLPEALAGLGRAGLRLPEELLPLALDRLPAKLRPLLLPVLGERGRWLAAARPGWAWACVGVSAEALPRDADQRWETAGASERLQLLGLARRFAPARARTWIAEGWKDERAEQRLAWVEALEAQLTDADTECLRTALTDRSALVKVAAARLLWKLPKSEVARSVRERADRLLDFRPERGELVVELPPEKYEKSWLGEGIVETPPSGVGRRQWWLAQLLAAVPPNRWTERFSCRPELLVRAAQAGEHAAALLDGWSSAVLRFGAAEWAAPLWDAWLGREAWGRLVEAPLHALGLLLTRDEADARFARLFAVERELRWLEACPVPWPPSVTRAFVSGLPGATHAWSQLLSTAALALPLSALAEIEIVHRAPTEDYFANQYARALERFEATLELRRRLAKEIPP